MSDANPVATPADVNVKLVKDDGVSKPADRELYQSLAGSLLYAAVATRPDIAQAVSAVARYTAGPSEAHNNCCQKDTEVSQGNQQHGPRLPSRKRVLTYIFGYGLGWIPRRQEISYHQRLDSYWSSHIVAEQETTIRRPLDHQCWAHHTQPMRTGDCLGPSTAA